MTLNSASKRSSSFVEVPDRDAPCFPSQWVVNSIKKTRTYNLYDLSISFSPHYWLGPSSLLVSLEILRIPSFGFLLANFHTARQVSAEGGYIVACESSSPLCNLHTRFGVIIIIIIMSSTTSPSNQDSSVAAGAPTTFSDHFKLLDQRTLYVDPSGDVELVAIHGDESKTFCVSSHAMRHASPAWRAMLDPANGFNEASFGEKPVKLHDDDFEALFIVLLASHLKFLDIPAKVEFDILVEICVVVDKYDCIGVLSPWLPGWVSQLATESHISENGPEWSFVAWITGNEEIFKHTTYQILISCKTNDSGECIDCSGDILDEVLPPGVSSEYIATSAWTSQCYS